ncbi:RNA-binding domain-containing protein [Zopfochytrium polystomum]|nr:RNA-binding domain-containing protein [Zopfochytrium polystomum]
MSAEAAAAPAPAVPASTTPEDDGLFKVFAGNLAFATSENDLKEIFSKAGTVVNAIVISRHNRSLGYGFISFATEDEAKKAVELLDKTEVAGRALNVEHVKPRAPGEKPATEKPPRAPRANRRKKSTTSEGDAAATDGAATATEGEKTEKGEKSEKPKRKFRNRRRSGAASGEEGAAARIDDAPAPEGAAGEEGAKAPKKTRKRRQPRRSSTAEGGEGAAAGTVSDAAGEKPARQRRPRARSQPTPADPNAPPAELSKTLLFVANLPFKVDDEKLAEIFKGFSVTSAKVITLRNGRSKGFGFVEVANEEEQQKVLNDLKNVQVEGRELVIRVAHASSELGRDGAAAAATPAAPAAAAPAAAAAAQ